MNGETLSRFREEFEKELKDNILSWWMKNSPDNDLGGFHGHIDYENQVVDPWIRCPRIGDYIFSFLIIKMSEFHGALTFF